MKIRTQLLLACKMPMASSSATSARRGVRISGDRADGRWVIASLAEAAKRGHGDQPPNDDITFVVVRCRA